MRKLHGFLIILVFSAIAVSQTADPQSTGSGKANDRLTSQPSGHNDKTGNPQRKRKLPANAPADHPSAETGSYIQRVVQVSSPPGPSFSSPDASEIVQLLGNPKPFTFKPRGSSAILIYSPKSTLTAQDGQLLDQIETRIKALSAVQPRILEITVSTAPALGSLIKKVQALNYGDIKVESVGDDKIRASFDTRVSPERVQAFVRDVQHLAAQPIPDSPVARVFFINAPEVASVLNGNASNSPSKNDTGATALHGKSGSPNASKTAEKSSSDTSTTKSTPSQSTAKKQAAVKAENTGEGDGSNSDSEDPPLDYSQQSPDNKQDEKSSADSVKPGVKSLNNDLLVFSVDHPGDDGTITEQKRILAAVDFPRPEVIINTFSFQTSSSNPDALYDVTTKIQREIGKYNDGIVVISSMAVLCFGALLKLGEARRDMFDRATAPTGTNSYVDEPSTAGTTLEPEPKSQQNSESKIHQTLGQALLLFMIAADIALGFLVGSLVRMHNDEDYTSWRTLKMLRQFLTALEKEVAELMASPEIAKKQCMEGILRAESVLIKRRRPPYHPVLAVVVFLFLFAARASWAQTIERYEGILIDTSGSISKSRTNSELFYQYLRATRKLLLTEPANSRVWVSSISTDSFGGAHEVLRGWTPDARGVFTDELNRARRSLVSNFEAKSSGMAPVAAGTDIFGGLWRLKALFESGATSGSSRAVSKTIWIFSDMMNETKDFAMPALLKTGAERMLDHAEANGLVVPLPSYEIYVYGASPIGLTPQAWATLKNFWTRYFSAAGAELVVYSAECQVER